FFVNSLKKLYTRQDKDKIKENDIYSLKGVCTLNEKQRQEQAQIKSESSKDSNKDRILSLTTEDFAHYFETTYEPPDIRKARKRGRDDIEVMAGILTEMGYESTTEATDADIILLNTCAIRENAENKVFGEIGHLKPLKLENPDLIIGVCGCMSQQESVVNRILQKHQQVDLIFGTHNIHRLPNLVQEAMFSKAQVVEVWSKEGDIIENLPKVRHGKIKAWVNIMYGCDKFCTYCIVPMTRGKERSRRPED